MVVTAVTPLRVADGVETGDFEDVTHACVQCGATLIRTVRHFSGDTPAIANRV